MKRIADVGQLLAVAGNSATYTVDLVAADGSGVTNIIDDGDARRGVPRLGLDPERRRWTTRR